MSQTESKSLGEQFPLEQARVREVLSDYKAIGAPGMLGAMLIEQALQRADQASISGDVIAMIRSFQELREITG